MTARYIYFPTLNREMRVRIPPVLADRSLMVNRRLIYRYRHLQFIVTVNSAMTCLSVKYAMALCFREKI